MQKTQKIIHGLIAGVFYVSAASAQIGKINNIGPTATEMDAIAFNSGGTLYGATGSAGVLYTINTATGVATLVHALVGVSNSALTYGVNGLAFQPGTGTLYGSTSPDSPNSVGNLVTINPATGQVTVIGPNGAGRYYTNISFAPGGTLYGWLVSSGGTTASAATINLATGAGTSLGSPQNTTILPWVGLAIDSSGVIYVTANGHGGAPNGCGGPCSGAFWTINPANGAPTTIGTLGGGPGVAPGETALAFSPGGVLYGIEGGAGGGWNLVTISLTAVGAPIITAVQNAASNIPPGLPNAGIAQGAIFVVYGSGLGPASISVASAAFQTTTLSNTSVSVTVGGITANAPMYYTSAIQVAALLPSSTPTGTGTISVSYNGLTGGKAPITVVANNLGIFTVDSSGGGPGIVTYPDYSLVSTNKAANCGGPSTTCGAANSGDTLILWATGLGPVNGNDASGAGLGQNMSNLPLKLWIGGVQAPVIYQGRSGCCIGEDQIVFTVPDNVPTGCAVPLLVEITSNNITQVSNNTIMPIAKGSRTCALIAPGTESANVAQLTGTVPIGDVELDHFLNDARTGFSDQAQFNFFTATVSAASQPFAGSYLDNLPVGACIAKTSSSLRGTSVAFTNLTPLDAGSSFTIKGPNGTMTVTAHTGDTPTLSTAGTFLVPGNYTITGTGGKDVGPFTANVSIQPFPTLTSPGSANNLTVSRSKGMTVTWNGNGSTGHVEMQLSSYVDANTGATVTCTAPASAGTFTIPSYMLSALPNGNGTGFAFQPGDGPGGPATSTTFTATGLLLGLAQTFIDGIPFGGFTIAN